MNEIINKLDLILTKLSPDLIQQIVTIGTPVLGSFIAVFLAYKLDKKGERKRNKEEFLKNINFLLVKNELNIRTLLSLKSDILKRIVTKNNEKSLVSLPKQFNMTSLEDIDINEMKLLNVDSNMTSLIFEFREIKLLIERELEYVNEEVHRLEDISTSETIYLKHFEKYNELLNHVTDNINAFLIRLVEINTHILIQAYSLTKKNGRDNIYEIHLDERLIELVQNKMDNEFIVKKYKEIEYLYHKNLLNKTFDGMERKDILIRVLIEIVKRDKE
jgi:hypothetical protein